MVIFIERKCALYKGKYGKKNIEKSAENIHVEFEA